MCSRGRCNDVVCCFGCVVDELSRLMDQLHVFVSVKPKPKQPTNVIKFSF